MTLKQLKKMLCNIYSLSCYVVHEQIRKKTHYFKVTEILCYFIQFNCQEKLITSKIKPKQTTLKFTQA